jgi:hypothetical protein
MKKSPQRRPKGRWQAVYQSLFLDPDFRKLTPSARFLFVVLRLQSNRTALYMPNWGLVSEITGLSGGALDKALASLEQPKPWIQREDGFVWIVKGMEHDPTAPLESNPNQRQGIIDELLALPDMPIRQRLLDRYGLTEPFDKALASLTQAFRTPEPEPEPNPKPKPKPENISPADAGIETAAFKLHRILYQQLTGTAYAEQPGDLQHVRKLRKLLGSGFPEFLARADARVREFKGKGFGPSFTWRAIVGKVNEIQAWQPGKATGRIATDPHPIISVQEFKGD